MSTMLPLRIDCGRRIEGNSICREYYVRFVVFKRLCCCADILISCPLLRELLLLHRLCRLSVRPASRLISCILKIAVTSSQYRTNYAIYIHVYMAAAAQHMLLQCPNGYGCAKARHCSNSSPYSHIRQEHIQYVILRQSNKHSVLFKH